MKKDRTCKYCNVTFTECEGKLFSNHVQWCDKNTDIDRAAIYAKQLEHAKRRTIPKQSFTKICPKCVSEFTVTCKPHHLHNRKYCPEYCSRQCANSRDHSVDTKEKIKVAVKHHLELHGSVGCVIGKLIQDKPCEYCSTVFLPKTKHIKCCSVTCASNLRRKKKSKTVMGDLTVYRKSCTFRFALNAYPNEFDFGLIDKYGWYKATNRGNNLTGVSRDHIMSVRYGFDNGISPEIISHPANCQLMQHGRNVSKSSGCGITLDDLKAKIDAWELKYGKFTPQPWKDSKTIQ